MTLVVGDERSSDKLDPLMYSFNALPTGPSLSYLYPSYSARCKVSALAPKAAE